jgi:two-component system, chemotaxis family, protein-glutamate methylesterase/glutaminase
VIPSRRSELELIAIGLSTGGPQALRAVIPRLPSNFPVPIAVVLHMPVGYTELYAARLNEISALAVVEAREEQAIAPGGVVIAAAGRHLRVARGPGKGLVARLSLEPAGVPHRPSVDALFESAAEVCGAATLGVVLTGMGSDGLQGARRIKERGGRMVSESAATCVVYGMPRSIEESGLSDYVTGLPELPTLLAQLV